MPEYFKQRINMSRAIDSESKKSCTYGDLFYFRDADGRLAQVSVYEDGFVYRSPATFRRDLSKPSTEWQQWRDGALKVAKGQEPPFRYAELPGELLAVPHEAQPCAPAEYEAALQLVLAAEKKKEEARQAEKQAKDALKAKKGMVRNQHAAEEADVAEPLEPAPARHFLDDFTILDFETANDKPIELAAIRFVNWQPVEDLQTFVALPAGEFVPARITDLTGITSSMLRGAPDVKQVLGKFRKLAGDSLLIAHNVVYDRRILEKSRTALGADGPLANLWLCTLTVARAHYPKLPSHKLPDLCQRWGISTKDNHRALKDVRMTFELLRKMHQEQPIEAALVGATSVAQAKKAAQPSLFAAA